MSIATEITRLQGIKTNIRNALVEQGIENANTHDMEDFADDILAIEGSSNKIYGFHVNSNESDPSTAVTYLEDAVGMTPAHMNFTSGTFDYGSWENAFFMPRPCMLKFNGQVDYYLNPNDYTKKLDGTDSDIANVNYGGNAMMEWGQNGKKIWYKIVNDSNVATSYSVYIADYQVDSTYHAWSFYNKDNALVDHFYTAIYSGSLDSNNKLRSLSGKTLMANKTAPNKMAYAKNNSSYHNIAVWSDSLLIYLLLYLMGKSLDLQTVYGQGWATGGSSSTVFTSGTTNDKGLFYGSSSTTQRIKVFGMEDFWGTLWNRCAGLMQTGGKAYYKLTEGTADGTTLSAYPTTAVTGMLDGGNVPTNGNYLKKCTGANGNTIIPSEVGGSSSTYYCDYYYVSTGIVAFALLGGGSGGGAFCGFFVSLDAVASFAAWGVGAALSCKPSI